MIDGATGFVFTVREYDFETEPAEFEASTFIVYVPAVLALPVMLTVYVSIFVVPFVLPPEFLDKPDGSPDTKHVIGAVPDTFIHPLYSSFA